MVVHFLDIGAIVDNQCLNFLFILIYNIQTNIMTMFTIKQMLFMHKVLLLIILSTITHYSLTFHFQSNESESKTTEIKNLQNQSDFNNRVDMEWICTVIHHLSIHQNEKVKSCKRLIFLWYRYKSGYLQLWLEKLQFPWTPV